MIENGLNSAIYRAMVYHRRLQVASHEFRTSMYTWYLDLDELDILTQRHPWLIGVNRPGVYTFKDSDHFRFWSDEKKTGALSGDFSAQRFSQEDAGTVPRRKAQAGHDIGVRGGPGEDRTNKGEGSDDSAGSDLKSTNQQNPGIRTKSHLRQQVNQYFREKDQPVPSSVFLLTNLRYLGYGFNPVSFYFALDDSQRLYAILAEVNNTFGEQKPYLILLDRPVDPTENKRIFARAWKNFYVSPFIDRDREFVFRMKLPDGKLSLGIDTYENEIPVLRAAYSGIRKPVNRRTMIGQMIRFPFITLKVIALIHWHAMILYIKKVPFFGKESTDAMIQKEEHKRKEVTNAAV